MPREQFLSTLKADPIEGPGGHNAIVHDDIPNYGWFDFVIIPYKWDIFIHNTCIDAC